MRYWWVNQNQTFQQEINGGYLWSPKRKSNNTLNPFYEFMREVAPGDVIFSFQGARIKAIGIARSLCMESPKPTEFGNAGMNWSDIGWKIQVQYFHLTNQIRPPDEMGALRPLIPERYSPLQTTGRGNQGVYLTTLPEPLAMVLVTLIGTEARDIVQGNYVNDYINNEPVANEQLRWENHLEQTINNDTAITETERETIVIARRGQGTFKTNVRRFENKCRITGVNKIEHLIASHCKPWRDCETHQERLDGENGLLLTPSIDHLFDRGLISFEDNGELLISNVAHKESLRKMGLPVDEHFNTGTFSEGQKAYLEYHREYLFLAANI